MSRKSSLLNQWLGQGIIALLFSLGLALICMLGLQNYKLALVVSFLPFVLLVAGYFISNIMAGFICLFILNYTIMGLNRYVSMKVGIVMTALSLLMFIILLFKSHFQRMDWSRTKSLPVMLWCIWLVYCIMEVFNIDAMAYPWLVSITTYAIFPLLAAVFVPVIFKDYKKYQWLLFIWIVLTGLAAAKGYWQRNRGFDSAELHWLYVEGGATTHLIYTGIRFFSFFPDAANFGSGMAQSFVTFAIAFFYVKNKWLRLFLLGGAIAGCYGMVISGTRSSLIIPAVGIVVYICLCKNVKAIVLSGIVLSVAIFILKFTNLGSDNGLVQRMRTVFDTEDASLQVRVNNQQILKGLMQGKPFGTGLGLGGGKAKRYKPDAPLSQIPTDSWMVMTWVETGWVGLIIYYGIFVVLILRACYISMFRLRNKELMGVSYALIAGIVGILVSSYGNEVLSYPNGLVVFCGLAALYVMPWYDKDISEKSVCNEENINHNGQLQRTS